MTAAGKEERKAKMELSDPPQAAVPRVTPQRWHGLRLPSIIQELQTDTAQALPDRQQLPPARSSRPEAGEHQETFIPLPVLEQAAFLREAA